MPAWGPVMDRLPIQVVCLLVFPHLGAITASAKEINVNVNVFPANTRSWRDSWIHRDPDQDKSGIETK